MAASLRVPWKICSILFFYVLFLTLVPRVILSFITYSREELLNIRLTSTNHPSYQEYDFPETDPVSCLPPNTTDLIPAGEATRRRKRGKRSGLLVRLRRRAHRAPLPSILLANVQSLENKVDEIRARVTFERDIRDCNVLCFTETWLTEKTLTESVQPAGFFTHRADRNIHLSGAGPLCTVACAALVFGGQLLMKERPQLHLRGPLVLWSLSLAIFSIVGAIRTGWYMLHILSTSGFRQSICDQSFYNGPVSKFWAYAFVLSNAPELGDSVHRTP